MKFYVKTLWELLGKRYVLLFKVGFLFFFLSCGTICADNLQTCKKHLIEWHTKSLYEDEKIVQEIIRLTDNGSYIDQSIKELYLNILLPRDTVISWLDSQLADGSWANIDYKDRSASVWFPSFHVIRMFHLAKSYCAENSALYHQERVLDGFISALKYWCDYENTSTNWWFTEIGINKILGPAVLMMEDRLPETLKEKVLAQLERSRIGKTGQNRVWLAGNVIYKALFQGDEQMLDSARNVMASEIYLTVQEGIQPDYSYHLHGPQLQFGNYGLAYGVNMSYWAYIFRDTKYSFTKDQLDILSNYLLKGLACVVWNGRMDFSACGRQLFRNAQRGKALALAQALSDISHVDSARMDHYRSSYNSILALTWDGSPEVTAFYRSDMLVGKTRNSYISVRFSSPRVIATETGNDENLKGYYLGEGVTSLMQEGDEYDNIFPIWDWRCLPGSTVPVNHGALPLLSWGGYRNGNAFSGVLADGKYGTAVFSLDRDGVTGKKGYFLFEDLLVCLGNDLKSSANLPLQTTVNQTYYKDGCTVRQDAETKVLQNGSFEMNPESEYSIRHGGWDYYIFPGQKGRIFLEEKSGSWHDIAKFYDTSRQSAKLFTCVLDNDKGRYAYMAAPSGKNTQKRFSAVEIMSQTERCQAVRYKTDKVIAAIFYGSDSLQLDARCNFITVTPAIYLFKPYQKGWKITVADPTQNLKTIVFEVSGKRAGGSYVPEKNCTRFVIDCPEGASAGSGVTVVL